MLGSRAASMSILSALFPPSIEAAQAAERVNSRAALVLDVRTRREYEAGRIAGAQHLPVGRLDAARLDPGQRYIAVCRTDMRSSQATRQLRRAGLEVVNLKGGMLAWQRAGLPLAPRNGHIA
jgi:rhodanese-related sulfurtransferase